MPSSKMTWLCPPPKLFLALIPLMASAACALPVQEQSPEWIEVNPASDADSPPLHSRTSISLGDPFVVVASDDILPPPILTSLPVPAVPDIDSAWLMLSSDACVVSLRALHVVFRSEEKASFITSTRPSPGVVLRASPHQAVIEYEALVQMSYSSSPRKPVPATIRVEIHQLLDQVLLHVDIVLFPDSASPLALSFVQPGVLNPYPEAVPERKYGCR